jgi:CheY-like chemotaxis protein
MRDDIGHLPTILVVEDNEHDIELLRHRFQEARLMNPLRIVRDGVAAAEYLEGYGQYTNRKTYPIPGIVVLDLMLPKMDGFEVLAWIRARKQFDSIPVLVLTAHNEDPMIERATKEGADGYLLKEEGIEGLIYLLKNEFMGWALVPAR